MTTSNTSMSTWLQIKEYQENCNIAKRSIGKRAVHKNTGERGTIIQSLVKGQDILYYINLDCMRSSGTALATYKDGLVIIGDSQY